jgi:hypothetical protein
MDAMHICQTGDVAGQALHERTTYPNRFQTVKKAVKGHLDWLYLPHLT